MTKVIIKKTNNNSHDEAWNLLNNILKEEYNTSIDEHQIIRNKFGKPSFIDNFLYFNLSHSNNIIMCSISDNPIGCDIEQYREVSKSLLNKYHINNNIDFLYYYTKKESRVKKEGISIFTNKYKTIDELNNIYTNKIYIDQKLYIYSIDSIDYINNNITIKII